MRIAPESAVTIIIRVRIAPGHGNAEDMTRIDKALKNCGSQDLQCVLRTAAAAALEAGKILKNLYGKPHQVRHKGSIDLVTEADVAAEDAILAILAREQPGVTILAEESHAQYNSVPVEPAWIIDPLDGTTNYAHGFPWFGVSVAYTQGVDTQVGVIYCPIPDELFFACRGGGAWLNHGQIRVSEIPSLALSLVATGFPYDVQQHPEKIMAAFNSVLVRAQDVRRAGAAALDLAYIACGRLDGFWEKGLKPWDTAAGKLLVEEAGGGISDYRGEKFSPFVPEILATNNRIHGELAEILKDFSDTGKVKASETHHA